MPQQFKLPDPGEGLVEAEIVTWRVQPGDQVTVNQVVVEVETAKSLVELPIPWEGTVTEILVPAGETVEVGTPIISIDTGDGADEGSGGAAGQQAGTTTGGGEEGAGEETGESGAGADDLVPDAEATAQAEAAEESGGRQANLVGYGPSEGATSRRRRGRGVPAGGPVRQRTRPEPERPPAARPLAKPPVRKYAKDNGVDLAQVAPTREDGVITRADVDAFLAGGGAGESAAAPAAAHPATQAPEDQGAQQPPPGGTSPALARPDRTGERETRTPVKGVRRMTAQAMVDSAFTAPHVTEFLTVDVTATMELVERLKADREFADVKVSPLLVLARAMTIAVRRNPGVNAVWDEETQEIVQRNYVNLGIAAATPRGLVVPNIKDADLMDLHQLAEALEQLVDTARAGRTQPAEMSGGTITITNVGVFGVDTGTPIINPGESAIVAFGAVRRQPWVVTGADGQERMEPRWVTQLAVSFDHRLIDGELGSRFLADLGALLEDPARALVWG